MSDRSVPPFDEIDSGSHDPAERIALTATQTEPWRTTTVTEKLIVETGHVLLHVAYGDDGDVLTSGLVAPVSIDLPPGRHHRCAAVADSVVRRARRDATPLVQ